MSQENVERVRRLYRAMEAGDYQAVSGLADPSVEWIPDQRRVGEGPVRGLENVIRFFRDRAEMFEDIRQDVERIRDRGDQVLVFLKVTGTGIGSGAPFELRIAHLLTLSNGVVVRGEGYGDRDEALEAAGLSE